jgi:regulator of sigma E protease
MDFSFLSSILYFIIVIFVLVTVHEFGHFIAGRIFGMHVPVFSVGMGRRLFGFNKITGFTLGNMKEEDEAKLGVNTDYRLSLLPIGGYAKIDGMIDETQNQTLPAVAQPWEFRAKPWWQKAIVLTAGVIMNLITAWLIFSMIKFGAGREIIDTTTVGYVSNKSISADAGVRAGDRVIAIDGKLVKNWDDVSEGVYMDKIARDFTITFDRAGQRYDVRYTTEAMGNVVSDSTRPMRQFGLMPAGYSSPSVEEVIKDEPAMKAGLMVGDTIVRVNGVTTPNQLAMVDQIKANPGKPIEFVIHRKGEEIIKTITPTAAGTIGVQNSSKYIGKVTKIEYGFFESFGLGWTEFTRQVVLFVRGIEMMFTGQVEVSKSVGGPIAIFQMSSKSAENGMATFFTFMALLSISLAALNILPVPALDGGHLLIVLVEAVMRRELSQGFKLGFQKVGVVLLLSLMAFMVFNDIRLRVL